MISKYSDAWERRMNTFEIILLLAGGIIFILSFFLPEKKMEISRETQSVAREEIASMVEKEMDGIKDHMDDVVEEAVSYAMEKTERSLERLSNEKIMAVSEYSDTVLAEIHKNHEEAMFLYDMLNNKHNNLKNTVSEVNRTVKEAEETVSNFQKLSPREFISTENVIMAEPEQGIEKSPVTEQTENVTVVKAEDDPGEAVADSTPNNRNRKEEILAMYRVGKSPVDIARELDLGVGEVKLVIDLFQKRRNK